jgi:HEPN domain-containing protein
VEKMLKAVIEKVTGKTPPKTHNLRDLMTEANISVPENVSDLIDELSDLSVPMRYPLDFEANSDVYTRDVAEEYFRMTEGSVKWIEKSLES